uniref:Serpentine receptor class gamma n=2 Tax=Acrobeloides nanus TaxID=290746 RepID=A0A914EDS4_9BILA
MVSRLLFKLTVMGKCVSYRIPALARYTNKDGNIAVLYDSEIIKKITLVERHITFLTTSSITFILELMTIIRYKKEFQKMTTNNKNFYGNKDVQLFLHCILMFITQFAATLALIIFLIGVLNDDAKIISIMQQFIVWILDFMSLASPVFLICVSTIVRRSYLQFYGFTKVKHLFMKPTQFTSFVT